MIRNLSLAVVPRCTVVPLTADPGILHGSTIQQMTVDLIHSGCQLNQAAGGPTRLLI